MTTTTTTTKQAVKQQQAVKVKVKAQAVYINSPKLNEVHTNCQQLRQFVQANGKKAEGLTALGHKVNCKGGVIDTVILTAPHLNLDTFVNALINSQLAKVKADIAKYGIGVQLYAILAKRTIDHVTWCSNTANDQHGGFGARLAKVSLRDSRQIIANDLKALASDLQASYKVQYAKTYNDMHKAIKA